MMDVNTIDSEFEYRMVNIIKAVLKYVDAEISVFQTTEQLLDFLYSADIALIFGRAVIDDMGTWSDEWLEEIKK